MIRYTLQIGLKPWIGKHIFLSLFKNIDPLFMLVILELILEVKSLPASFIENAVHTKEKQCTLILMGPWRMRILKTDYHEGKRRS